MMAKRGHSNMRTEELERVPNSSASGDYAMIPIFGGASVTTAKELPPLSIRCREWEEIGAKMGWSSPDPLEFVKNLRDLSDARHDDEVLAEVRGDYCAKLLGLPTDE